MSKRQKQYLENIFNEYTSKDNLYPKSMSTEEFTKIIIDYFLGEDYTIVDSINPGQANTHALIRIIEKYKGVK